VSCSSCEGDGSLASMYTTKWGIRGKESHLTFRIATIGTVCVGLDEFSDREPIRGFIPGR